jgi:hypothetical protein
METLEQRIQRVAQEDVAITPYDPRWPELFRQEKGHLLNCLPNELIRRIEHFGSLESGLIIETKVKSDSRRDTEIRHIT